MCIQYPTCNRFQPTIIMMHGRLMLVCKRKCRRLFIQQLDRWLSETILLAQLFLLAKQTQSLSFALLRMQIGISLIYSHLYYYRRLIVCGTPKHSFLFYIPQRVSVFLTKTNTHMKHILNLVIYGTVKLICLTQF